MNAALREAGAIVVPEVLGADVCGSLVRSMRASRSRPSEPLNRETGKREPHPQARQKMHDVVALWRVSFAMNVERALPELFGELYYVDERVLFLSYPPGSFIAPHADDDPRELGAAVLVLNDDFEGGEFVIHHGERELALEVPTGSLIALRAGVVHSVREVTDGTRYVAVGALNRV